MIKTIFFAALLPAVLFKNSHQHLLSFPNFPEERVSPPLCTTAIQGTSNCFNCVTSQFCFISNNGAPNLITTTCSGSTPVCGFDGSVYACIASNANCQCPGTPGLSYLSDPFNSHYYTTCSGTNTVRMNCDSNYYDPQSHSCTATPPVPPCPGAGVFEDSDPATCDGYIICQSSSDTGIVDKCPPPTIYFNPTIRKCDNPVPPFRCQAGYLGYYADPFDCKRYYFCNGVNLLSVTCCPGVEVFDSTTSSCSTTVPCLALPQCARATTTTPTPTTSTTPLSSASSSTPSSSTSSTTQSSSTSSATSSSTTTTTLNPGCTPLSSFTCPAPDGFYPQCSYCARTYFRCVSGTATLLTCSGSLLFNIVPTYPACLSTCPYYP